MLSPARKTNPTETILVSLSVAVVYLFLSITGLLDIPKLKTNDLFFSLAHKIKPTPSQINQIALIRIDDDSYAKLNRKWPWKRDTFAYFLQKLKSYNPKIICFDLTFVGEATPEEDRLLAEAIKEAGNVFVGSYVSPSGEYILPKKIFLESALGYGFIDKLRDKDNVMRSASLVLVSKAPDGFLNINGYSLEFAAISKYLGVSSADIDLNSKRQEISLNTADKKICIPLRKDMSTLINYAATEEQFRNVPFWKVMKDEAPKDAFKDKIVIVGITGEIFHDIHPTPLGLMPGMDILANTLLMLLSGNFIRELNPLVNFLILIFLCLATAIVTHRLSLLKGLAFALSEIAIFALAGLYLNLRNWQLDIFSPILIIIVTYAAISLYEYVALLKETSSLRTLAITDGLTELFVHRYFEIRLQYEFDRMQRYGGELALVMLDLDRFKDFNDTYGHESGNIALKTVAKAMRESSRKIDILARYGGEEFCAILPATRTQGALVYAEKLRKNIEDLEIIVAGNKKTKITVSIGVASFIPNKTASAKQLVEYADQALYEAKRTGKNRVCLSTANEPQGSTQP